MKSRLGTNLLFVSGMPQDSTEEQINNYFNSRFGGIAEAQVLITGNRSRNFLVKTNDYQVYLEILATRDVIFRGRHLHCKPYTEKKSHLKSIIQEANERRIILKKVPSKIPEKKVADFLKNLAGDIEMIFYLRSETAVQAQFLKFRKYRTYSVLFKEKESAEKLARLKTITLDEESQKPVIVEKYLYRGAGNPKPEWGGSLPQQTKYQKKPPSLARERFKETSQKSGLHQWATTGLVKDYQGSQFSTAELSQLYDQAGKLRRVDINASMHSIKPTSKSYFMANTKFLVQPSFALQYRVIIKRSPEPSKTSS